jgi:GDP-D-mannose 3',5'-epimerase
MGKILIAGAGGFIGGHLARMLSDEGHDVRAVDIKPASEWYQTQENAENLQLDMADKDSAFRAVSGVDQVFNLACDMGGIGFIENNKAACMLSVLINTNLLMAARQYDVSRYFYSSSACVYAAGRQLDPSSTALAEVDAYPAQPEDGYGWEKLFSERLCRHFREDFALKTRVARFHNVFGPYGTWDGGREKAPAAICRKVILAKLRGHDSIEIWGDGHQTRSFMYIDDCLHGMRMIADGDYVEPLNLGTSELVSINKLVDMVCEIADVNLKRIHNLDAPQGVRGRNSDNSLIKSVYGWEPTEPLRRGLEKTFYWISQEIASGRSGT